MRDEGGGDLAHIRQSRPASGEVGGGRGNRDSVRVLHKREMLPPPHELILPRRGKIEVYHNAKYDRARCRTRLQPPSGFYLNPPFARVSISRATPTVRGSLIGKGLRFRTFWQCSLVHDCFTITNKDHAVW